MLEKMIKIVRNIKYSAGTGLSLERCITTSAIRCIDQKWRADRGLPMNPNAFGPLTNLPDYTFLDGRPTPLGSNLRRRIKRQREVAERIVTLNSELQFAIDRYNRMKSEEAMKQQKLEESQLKQKGHLLFKKS